MTDKLKEEIEEILSNNDGSRSSGYGWTDKKMVNQFYSLFQKELAQDRQKTVRIIEKYRIKNPKSVVDIVFNQTLEDIKSKLLKGEEE